MIKVTKQDLLLLVLKFVVSSIVRMCGGGVLFYMYVSVQASSGLGGQGDSRDLYFC